VSSRPGCFAGFLKLIMLTWLFDWLQDTFGFGRGCSCSGCGCGVILWILFIVFCLLDRHWDKLVPVWFLKNQVKRLHYKYVLIVG